MKKIIIVEILSLLLWLEAFAQANFYPASSEDLVKFSQLVKAARENSPVLQKKDQVRERIKRRGESTGSRINVNKENKIKRLVKEETVRRESDQNRGNKPLSLQKKEMNRQESKVGNLQNRNTQRDRRMRQMQRQRHVNKTGTGILGPDRNRTRRLPGPLPPPPQ